MLGSQPSFTQRRDEARVVEHRAVSLRRQKAERDPEDDREQHGAERQLDRRGKAMADLEGDRAERGDARAEVAVTDGLDEVTPVLNRERVVESVLLPDLRDRLGRRPLAEQRFCRRAGEGTDPEEHEDRQPDEDRDEEQQPANDESQHLSSAG
jgi:hypothetical protein